MLTKNILFKNFSIKSNNLKTKKLFKNFINENLPLLDPLKKNYKYSYTKKLVSRLKKFSNFRIIGMGGSALGTEAIYNFLKHKIKKKIIFVNNLDVNSLYFFKKNKNKNLNLIISKSGNTLETIVNTNILIKKNDKNIILTENKNNYLRNLGYQIKAEILEHKNYIGGRYSVLSEVGMLPAELMGLNEKKFKQFNNLIKNKKFIYNLIENVSTTLAMYKKSKFTSIILNYDERSEGLFKWYQQLVAESLGKKSKGILPVTSSMPKDNHSLMQLYLDGNKNNFFTFFSVNEKDSSKINNNLILPSHNFLKGKTVYEIAKSQRKATEIVFKKRKIPFRTFEIVNRDEKTLGELFCFFILETILLGKALNVNPFDQPSVELIKYETKNLLV
tara:strand:- start:598 stop:1761 length:1164 start_codon:yes stop_codon:yes gene_type:complete